VHPPLGARGFRQAGLFSDEYDQEASNAPARTYFILAIPGMDSQMDSQYLAQTLTSLGYGVPAEYFNFQWLAPAFARRWGCLQESQGRSRIPLEQYVEALLQHRTTPNGFFGAFIQFHNARRLIANPAIRALFFDSRLVVLKSRDPLDSALSLYLAQSAVARPGDEKPRAPQYDHEAISRALNRVLARENRLAGWLASLGLPHLEVFREDLARAPHEAIEKIVHHVSDIPPRIGQLPAPHAQPAVRPHISSMKTRFIRESRARLQRSQPTHTIQLKIH
jgi:LPS sulfotransferase NodH